MLSSLSKLCNGVNSSCLPGSGDISTEEHADRTEKETTKDPQRTEKGNFLDIQATIFYSGPCSILQQCFFAVILCQSR